MILVDTSVWIGHFRLGDAALVQMLEAGLVLTHPFVLGELASGNLRNRADTLRLLRALPRATAATDDEVNVIIDGRKLWGKGIGWIDAHLLAAALLSGCNLWTLDGRLDAVASAVGVKGYARA
jgi:predicted nucleic acid-binding protein